jgi:phosphate:Na+ symporter
MNISAFVSIIAGIGLFVIGIKGIAANMSQLAGRRLRDWLARSTSSYLAGAFVGVISGALTQSTNAITIILMSLFKADLITLERARPVLLWANVGTVVLVAAASVDIHAFALIMVSAAGACSYLDLDRSPRWRLLAATLFSLALLFLGMELMRQGAHDVGSLEWVKDVFAYSARWNATAFAIGIVLAVFTQSSATVSVIAMAMASAGLVTLDQAMITLYGASLGSGFGTYVIARSMKGKARQLALLQVIVKMLGVAVLLPLFIVERYSGQPLLVHGIAAVTDNPNYQIALVYAVIQLISVVAQEILNRPLQPLITMLCPPSAEDTLSTPRYLFDQAIEDPETALGLVDREQARIFELLPLHLGKVENWDSSEPLPARSVILPSAKALCGAVDHFLRDLSTSGGSRDVLALIANRQSRNLLVLAAHEALDELAVALAKPLMVAQLRTLLDNLGEGLGALLLTAADANRSLDPDDLAMLRHLTADRDSLVDTMRRRVIASEAGLSADDHQLLYGVTSLFERVIWLLRRYSMLLTPKVIEPAAEGAAYGVESRAIAAS